MKKIKFRAWDKCNERMVEPRNILKICMSRLNQEPYLIVYLKKWMNENREIKESDKSYTNEFELMQYTGIKDKNGAEIYEGDIVEFRPWNGEETENYIVKFISDDASFRGIKEKKSSIKVLSLINSEQGLKIIGNISENPELLEVKHE